MLTGAPRGPTQYLKNRQNNNLNVFNLLRQTSSIILYQSNISGNHITKSLFDESSTLTSFVNLVGGVKKRWHSSGLNWPNCVSLNVLQLLELYYVTRIFKIIAWIKKYCRFTPYGAPASKFVFNQKNLQNSEACIHSQLFVFKIQFRIYKLHLGLTWLFYF